MKTQHFFVSKKVFVEQVSERSFFFLARADASLVENSLFALSASSSEVYSFLPDSRVSVRPSWRFLSLGSESHEMAAFQWLATCAM